MRNYKLSDKATRWQQICAQIQFPRSSAMLSLKLIQFIVLPFEFMYSKLPPQLGTIHLRRRQIFTLFWPLPPYHRQFFSTIRRQIWQIFDPSPPRACRRLKWMVPMHIVSSFSAWYQLEIKMPRLDNFSARARSSQKIPARTHHYYLDTLPKDRDFITKFYKLWLHQ